MEETFFNDFLMKQAPVIAVLLGIAWMMYKYFTAQQEKKDTIIKEKDALFITMMNEKDEKLEQHQKAVMELYGKAIETQNKCNLVQEQLLEVLKDTQADVNRLTEKIIHLEKA